jgi:hypothetical protein
MDIAAAFFKAAVDSSSPLTCLGLPLRVYSLWHQTALREANNPAIVRGIPSYNDLIYGVFVCAQTWEQYQESLKDGSLMRSVKKWGKKVAKAVKKGRIDLAVEAVNFRDYVLHGNEEPDINRNVKQSGRPLASSWEARLKICLMRELRLTESEALNRSLRQSNLEMASIAEMEGTAEPFSKEDKALFDIAKSMPDEPVTAGGSSGR